MNKQNKQPHERMTEKNNGLKDTQEVLYQDDFNRADAAAGNKQDRKSNDHKNK